MILIIQIILFACAMFIMWRVFYIGVITGVDIFIKAQLEYHKEPALPMVASEFVEDRRKVIEEGNYQKWRRKYKLPNTADTRALYADADYRTALEAQENGQ